MNLPFTAEQFFECFPASGEFRAARTAEYRIRPLICETPPDGLP